jgi:BMFP domain-containing protein YqiC
MLDPKKITELVQEVVDALPPGLKNLPQDVRQNFREALQATLLKMNLVTREEFDAQKAVLERTREKLEILEQKVKELEGE